MSVVVILLLVCTLKMNLILDEYQSHNIVACQSDRYFCNKIMLLVAHEVRVYLCSTFVGQVLKKYIALPAAATVVVLDSFYAGVSITDCDCIPLIIDN